MRVDQNKAVVRSFFERFAAADVESALALLDNDVVWQAMGKEGELPLSGTMDKEGVGNLIRAVKEMMPDGLALTPTGWTAEDNRVALEMESYGTKTNGMVYNNFYHFLITLREGRIATIREYMDTYHVKQVFIDDQ